MANDLTEPGHLDEYDVVADMASGALEGLIEAWQVIVTRHAAGLRVNLLFSRDTPELEVRSYIPIRGLVELKIKRPFPS